MSGPIPTNGRSWLRRPLFTTLVMCSLPAAAQTAGRAIGAVNLERLANGTLGIMSYTLAPDVTTSSLAIDNAATANPGLTMTQVGAASRGASRCRCTWTATPPTRASTRPSWSATAPTSARSR
jgi:hypothetical protein